MNIQSMSVSMEKYVMPLANKLGMRYTCGQSGTPLCPFCPSPLQEVLQLYELCSLRGPRPEQESPGLEPGSWRSNSMIFSWINALTLGAMSLYICIESFISCARAGR